jgi:hypothetical protein
MLRANTSCRKFISKRIPSSEKNPSDKASSEKPASALTGPRLAALYQQLKQQAAEEGKNGDNPKTKGSNLVVPNGGLSRGESSKSALS